MAMPQKTENPVFKDRSGQFLEDKAYKSPSGEPVGTVWSTTNDGDAAGGSGDTVLGPPRQS